MAIKTVLDILAADAGVGALVGVGTAARITPLVKPQDIELPAVTLSRVSLTPANVVDGTPAPIDENQVQVDSWDVTYAGARALASACRAALEAANILMLSELDNFDPSAELSGFYRVTQTFALWL